MGYSVIQPEEYGELLRTAGFANVIVQDATPRFSANLRDEMDLLAANRNEFLASFTEADLNYMVDRWAMKVGFCQAGDMKWGIYLATKPA
jgi:phosphoethanolamine N-methyltransferase